MKPPRVLVLDGRAGAIPWAEAPHGRRDARARCPAGCGRRDIPRERYLGMSVVCLRCFTWTWDPEGWRIPPPEHEAARERARHNADVSARAWQRRMAFLAAREQRRAEPPATGTPTQPRGD